VLPRHASALCAMPDEPVVSVFQRVRCRRVTILLRVTLLKLSTRGAASLKVISNQTGRQANQMDRVGVEPSGSAVGG